MKFVCRPAKPQDVDALVDLSMESVKKDPLPVKPDPEAMRETLRSMISSPAHFVWVSEADGVVVAGVAACALKSYWYRGLQCSVMLYYSRVRGAGWPLLRQLVKWFKPRSGIKVCVVELEPNAPRKLVRSLKRIGFTRGH